ncbi:hypothetical protein YC2023_037017 [Brassica napus]
MLDSDKLSRRHKLKVEEEIGKLKVEEEIGKRRRRPEQKQHLSRSLVRAPGMSLLKIILSKPSSVAKGVSMRNGLALRLMKEKRKWFSNYLGRQSFLTQNSFHLQQMDADSSSSGEYKGDGRERWSHPTKSPRSEYNQGRSNQTSSNQTGVQKYKHQHFDNSSFPLVGSGKTAQYGVLLRLILYQTKTN